MTNLAIFRQNARAQAARWKRDSYARWPFGLVSCATLALAALSAGCGADAALEGEEVGVESAALGGTITLPGRIQAEEYKIGGEGVGYHDSNVGNSGGQYRTDDVDIEATSDTGAGYNVGWTAAGEWLAYSVNVSSAGTYQLTARVASGAAGTKTVGVTLDGASLGQASFSDASGWQAWRDLSLGTANLSAGSHQLRIQMLTGGFNINYLDVAQQATGIAVPGRVQAEDYKSGGEGVGYHDTTSGNTGGQYRQDNVDIEATSDAGGGYNLGWTDTGEWLEYTLNVTKASTYALTARVASGAAGTKTLGVVVDGTSLGSASFTSANGWQSWQDLSLASKQLSAGAHTLRIQAQTGGFNLNYVDVAEVGGAAYTPRVLFVGYNPSDGTTTLADRYFGGLYGGKTADQVEVATAQAEVDAFTALSGGRIKYQVVATVHDRTFPVYSDGSTYTMDSYGPCAASGAPQSCEDRKYRFQYQNWVAQNNLCALAAQNNVDEIWVQSAPYIMTWENFMIGPTAGFDVNGPSFVTPGCSKHYVVHNPTYQAPPQAFLHIYGHRVEATMNFLTGKWRAADRQQHWERFAVTSRYSEPYNVIEPDLPNAYCGNAHWPSNGQMHYDYGNSRQKASICGDWANFPNYNGSSVNVTCNNWGCSDNGWGAYWLGALPHASGTVSMTSASGVAFAFPKDWWSLLLYPDQALSFNAPL